MGTAVHRRPRIRLAAAAAEPAIATARQLEQERPVPRTSRALQKTLAGPSLRRSLLVSLIVGTALNLINQGPELFSGQAPIWWKLLLTYVVPFVVASYGSFAAFRSSGD
jgi:hypothetical protein